MFLIKWLNGFIILFFLISCQSIPPQPIRQQTYLTFEEGVRQLSYNLMIKLQEQQGRFQEAKTMVMNPFLDVDSGQVIQTSLDIEKTFTAEVHNRFQALKIVRITPQTLEQADYLVNGLIKYETNNPDQLNKHYQISAVIVDLKNQMIATKGKVWIISEGLNYQPTPSYEDNPMYIKGDLLQQVTKTMQAPVGSKIDENYYEFVKIKALIIEAQTTYDQGHYKKAIDLFKAIAQQPLGQMIEVYGGLYMAYFKLGHLTVAEKNFRQMVDIGFKQDSLPVKLLFQTDLTDFLDVPELKTQYTIWLRQISRYLEEHTQYCIHIIGHTSRYGVYDYNKLLSKRRAEKIQILMSQTFPGIIQHSETIGKGPDETIVGTVPDSIENAIDRRVEFKIADC